MRDVNPSPPPAEAGTESGAKKPWSPPRCIRVDFDETRGTIRVAGFNNQENDPMAAIPVYDPNVS